MREHLFPQKNFREMEDHYGGALTVLQHLNTLGGFYAFYLYVQYAVLANWHFRFKPKMHP